VFAAKSPGDHPVGARLTALLARCVATVLVRPDPVTAFISCSVHEVTAAYSCSTQPTLGPLMSAAPETKSPFGGFGVNKIQILFFISSHASCLLLFLIYLFRRVLLYFLRLFLIASFCTVVWLYSFYSGSVGFNPRPENRLYCLKFPVVFLSSSSKKLR
jgi:hypothetical protein